MKGRSVNIVPLVNERFGLRSEVIRRSVGEKKPKSYVRREAMMKPLKWAGNKFTLIYASCAVGRSLLILSQSSGGRSVPYFWSMHVVLDCSWLFGMFSFDTMMNRVIRGHCFWLCFKCDGSGDFKLVFANYKQSPLQIRAELARTAYNAGYLPYPQNP